MGLKNQVALGTGGGRAIGRCIALRLAREGAELCIVGREETADEIRELGARAEPIVADVRNEDQVQAAAGVDRYSGQQGRHHRSHGPDRRGPAGGLEVYLHCQRGAGTAFQPGRRSQ